jgi:hypothetical protein
MVLKGTGTRMERTECAVDDRREDAGLLESSRAPDTGRYGLSLWGENWDED